MIRKLILPEYTSTFIRLLAIAIYSAEQLPSFSREQILTTKCFLRTRSTTLEVTNKDAK